MRLEAVEVHRVALGFRRPVHTAAGTHRQRPVTYVRVVTDAAEGWGECSALADGTLVDPPLDVVDAAIERSGIERLWAAARARSGALPPATQVAALFDTSPVARSVAATLEMAVLDAELRRDAVSLWRRLGVDEGVAARGVPVGRLVGIPANRDVETLLGAVAATLAQGTARLRLKVEPGWDSVPVRAVRSAFPDVAMQVDANGAYRLDGDGIDDAARLASLDGLGLTCVEQPLPPGDLVALATLAARLETPVGLDESLTSLRRVEDALRYRACGVACVKPGRLGGVFAARRAQQLCEDAGVGAFVGGFFETGLARSANAALAGLAGFNLPGDLGAPEEYLEEDPVGYPGLEGRAVRPYGGPGMAPLPGPSVRDGGGAPLGALPPAGRDGLLGS